MHETGQKLLNLMFRPGETVCVSHNKYAYHSIPLENAFLDTVTLVSTDPDRPHEKVDSGLLTLVALNPIKGFRDDENCTAYRSFLVEMDDGPLKQQLEYVRRIGLPYSAVIFSGGKSLHFLVTLDTDLPNENTYRIFSEWILTVINLADQKTKNPSRGIRIPGAIRDGDKRQALVEFKGQTKLTDLVEWLKKFPDAKPKKREKRVVTGEIDATNVRKWVRDRLRNGLDPRKGRNQQWFAIAYEFALSGYSHDDTITILEQYYSPDRDFKEREWLRTIKSAFEKLEKGK